MLKFDKQLQEGKVQCEQCIQQLTSEQYQAIIQNSEELLMKMLQYSEKLHSLIEIVQPLALSVKEAELAQNQPNAAKNETKPQKIDQKTQ